MRILVGLGNPGGEYEKTRHNAGFWTLDAVAKHLNISKWKESKGGLLAETTQEKEKILLFKPQGFMNRSGLAVRQIVDFYQIPSENIAVIFDDVYIQPGSARVRKGGGDGGHNGLRSIIEHVDPEGFLRIKVGVGLYGQKQEERVHQPALDHYVLQALPVHDHKLVEKLIDKILPNLIGWLEHGTALETETIHI